MVIGFLEQLEFGLLRLALLAVAAQVFENSFDGDFRAVETAFMGRNNLVLFLNRRKQSLSRLGKNTD